MITNEKFFDLWADDYDSYLPKIPNYKRLVAGMVKKLKIDTGANVLDVGIGTGFVAFSVLRKTACEMHGVDISANMLKKARIKANKLGLKVALKKANAKSMRLAKNSFDAIVSAYSLHHLKDNDKLTCLKNIHSGLKKGGIFINGDMFIVNENIGPKRFNEVLKRWGYRSEIALKCAGHAAAKLELDHISLVFFKEGEFIISIKKWKELMKKAGFKSIGHKVVDAKTGDFMVWGEK